MEEVGPEEAMPAVGVVARTAAFSKELDQPLELLALAVVAAELAAAAPPLARRSTSHYLWLTLAVLVGTARGPEEALWRVTTGPTSKCHKME
jgi:hypothetical protein